MKNKEQHSLFQSLTAISRMWGVANESNAEGNILTPVLQDFLDGAWLFITQPQKLKLMAKKAYGKLGMLIVQEDEASETQMIRNYLFYATSDLAMYFIDEDAIYLDSPRDWEIEQARFRATQEVLGDIEGACILTPELERKIESSEIFKKTLRSQIREDELLAAVNMLTSQNIEAIKTKVLSET